MSPEQRASDVLQAYYKFTNSYRGTKEKPFDRLKAEIAKAIGEVAEEERRAMADQVQHAVEAEREACAKLVENFDAIDDENGGFVTADLGSWRKDGEEEAYQPDEDKLAAAIRGRT